MEDLVKEQNILMQNITLMNTNLQNTHGQHVSADAEPNRPSTINVANVLQLRYISWDPHDDDGSNPHAEQHGVKARDLRPETSSQ